MNLELSDAVAVVTGANKGIGLAITKALVAEGAYVVAGSLLTENLDGREEVATIVTMLASHRTANVTGVNYVVDGGPIKTT